MLISIYSVTFLETTGQFFYVFAMSSYAIIAAPMISSWLPKQDIVITVVMKKVHHLK
ncbi:hypothetical protein ACQKMD_12810 [Viridibacillus sp. NPDC096237]|uniref:hypothetical protein n=1 Tax=Viridibacillus sp. NPDC096237 TaxID=3390721 RepID=UPI003CFC45B4